MKKSEFSFDLPKELIAQTPLLDRSASRLMYVDRKNQKIEHHLFKEIVDYFKSGDVLVRNNTKVLPARLFGVKEETGAKVELLLLKQNEDVWECLAGNARVIKEGTIISFKEGLLKAKCKEVKDKGIRIMEMIYDGIFYEIIEELGNMPLPPYIKERLEDKNRYQTVYAQIMGSSAAPTAGLHFTDEIFRHLQEKGVKIVDVTLHVGLGTFKPMDVEDINDHDMHSELYEMSSETAEILNDAKQNNKRIIAIGTTSTRTLEAIYKENGCFKACSGSTNIFIYPGIKLNAIDGLVTNFHLPESTLIMLVSAFASKELILKAYDEAILDKYRFFSFGDAMLIL